jgi:nitric oxide synthase oxygenase domain/subunit
MKIKFKPTITITVPEKFDAYVDEAKCNRYCGYDAENGQSFEAQLTEMALTRFLAHVTATAIADLMQDSDGLDFSKANWLNVANELALSPIEIEWPDDA